MSDQVTNYFPVSVKGIVFIDNKVLLLKNERDEWELPGGRLEAGESPEQCVIREITEETKLDTSIDRIINSWVYHVNDTNVLIVIYLMRVLTQDTSIIEVSHEHTEIGFFSLSQIDTLNMPNGYKDSLRKALL